jgi:hypothetical protein
MLALMGDALVRPLAIVDRHDMQINQLCVPCLVTSLEPPRAPNGRYLKSPAKSASRRGVCGGDMSPPSGTCETRKIKSGSEKRIVAGHVGDITSRAAETPL